MQNLPLDKGHFITAVTLSVGLTGGYKIPENGVLSSDFGHLQTQQQPHGFPYLNSSLDNVAMTRGPRKYLTMKKKTRGLGHLMYVGEIFDL